jgi:hypothetical protein
VPPVIEYLFQVRRRHARPAKQEDPALFKTLALLIQRSRANGIDLQNGHEASGAKIERNVGTLHGTDCAPSRSINGRQP